MKNINQHTVPQCYLKGLGCDRPNEPIGSRKQIFVFDKVRKVSHTDSIRKISTGSRFYDIPEEIIPENLKAQLDLGITDKALQETEALFATTLRQIRNLQLGQVVSNDLIYDLSYLMAVQFSRSLEMRKSLVEAWVKLNQAIGDGLVALNFSGPSHSGLQFEFDERFHSVLHAYLLISSEFQEGFAKSLLDHIWTFGIVSNESPLYASDNPVVRQTLQHDPLASASRITLKNKTSVCEIVAGSVLPEFQAKGVEIFFPLNANLLLILKEKTSFPIHEVLAGRVVKAFDADIKLNNRLQVEQSVRQIYCQSNEFDLARKVCEEKPEVCDVERIRSVVTSGIERPTSFNKPEE